MSHGESCSEIDKEKVLREMEQDKWKSVQLINAEEEFY
jgi:hypothetical protein